MLLVSSRQVCQQPTNAGLLSPLTTNASCLPETWALIKGKQEALVQCIVWTQSVWEGFVYVCVCVRGRQRRENISVLCLMV